MGLREDLSFRDFRRSWVLPRVSPRAPDGCRAGPTPQTPASAGVGPASRSDPEAEARGAERSWAVMAGVATGVVARGVPTGVEECRRGPGRGSAGWARGKGSASGDRDAESAGWARGEGSADRDRGCRPWTRVRRALLGGPRGGGPGAGPCPLGPFSPAAPETSRERGAGPRRGRSGTFSGHSRWCHHLTNSTRSRLR